MDRVRDLSNHLYLPCEPLGELESSSQKFCQFNIRVVVVRKLGVGLRGAALPYPENAAFSRIHISLKHPQVHFSLTHSQERISIIHSPVRLKVKRALFKLGIPPSPSCESHIIYHSDRFEKAHVSVICALRSKCIPFECYRLPNCTAAYCKSY